MNLERGSQGVGIVRDGLPWHGAKTAERLDQLEKRSRCARRLYDSGQERDYQASALQFFEDLRSAWERGLEDRIFCGVVVRHRDYINHKNLKRYKSLKS